MDDNEGVQESLNDARGKSAAVSGRSIHEAIRAMDHDHLVTISDWPGTRSGCNSRRRCVAMNDDVSFRLQWDGLEVEACRPPEHAAMVLGLAGNELLRLNAALIARNDELSNADG